MILGIYCAGGFGGVVLGLARCLNENEHRWSQLCFIDDVVDPKEYDIPVYTFEEFQKRFSNEQAEVVIANGEPQVRQVMFEKVKTAGYKLPNLIHPMSDAKVITSAGEGNIILSYAYVSTAGVSIGDNNVVMAFSQISHNNTVGSHCVIASSVNLSGNTRVGDRAYIGTGAKLRENITVGRDSIVGMGAVVTKSVAEESVVMGFPAKEVRKNNGRVF